MIAAAMGYQHTCVLTNNGAVRCWGQDISGQTNVPADLGPATALTAREQHTCARTTNGAVRCWGSNVYSQSTVPSDLGPARYRCSRRSRAHLCRHNKQDRELLGPE